ncbi:CoA transferase [Haliea sp. E17]|uniref:CoA transferase n=1 Tax=Haliea sp. E17 TaxID=3401576 RepID=UPI003AB106E4
MPATDPRAPLSPIAHAYARLLAPALEQSAPGFGEGMHPVVSWQRSGLSALCGRPDGPPGFCPVPLPDCADGALAAFRAITGKNVLPGLRGADLLVERARITGHRRNGGASLSGDCRLLACSDAVLGVNLPRDSDWELLPAWLETAPIAGWEALAEQLAHRPAALLLERARLLGLAVVEATRIPREQQPWCRVTRFRDASPNAQRPPRVIDLSSLWAGPLCSRLWQAAGAEVIKVESLQRPDGARSGPAEFFARMNSAKQELNLALHTPAGQAQLRELVRSADIVLEASRPRALRQMGLVAEDILAEQPGLSWLSITGYGRAEPQANWIAYGDDAAIAAGLSAVMHAANGQWLVVGDAIADPLTGLHAALAGWEAWRSGGGQLVDVALAGVVRHCITATAPEDGDYATRCRHWLAQMETDSGDD